MALGLLLGASVAQAQQQCPHEEGTGTKACCQKVVIENIMTRTSIRKFKQQPVEDEKIETMLRAAMAAPTAANKQPWHFIVVTDKQVLGQRSVWRLVQSPRRHSKRVLGAGCQCRH